MTKTRGIAALTTAEIIKRYVEYKPGYKIRVEPGAHTGEVMVIMTYHADNADEPKGRQEVGVMMCDTYVCPPLHFNVEDNIEHLKRWMKGFVHQAECHEADEWLRFGGERVTQPHK